MKKQDLDLYGKMLHALYISKDYRNYEPTTILLKKEDNQYKVIIEAMNKDCPDEVIYYKTDENVASNLDENDLIQELSEWNCNRRRTSRCRGMPRSKGRVKTVRTPRRIAFPLRCRVALQSV